MNRSRGPRSRKRSARGSRLRAKLLALATLVALGAGAAGASLWFWAHRAGPPGELVVVEIPEGASLKAAALELSAKDLLSGRRWFELYARMTRASERVRAGDHLLRRGLSPAALLARITRSSARPVVKLTVVEGHNRFQIAERLEMLEVSLARSFLSVSADRGLLESLGVPGDSAEGYLFPATYDLYVNSDPRTILRTLVQEGLGRFRAVADRHARQLELRRGELGWSLHELVILASIIEKEAADPSEHGPIASVFYNRLRDPSFRPKRMLQSDPTAGYGCLIARESAPSCRDYAGIVTPLMLRDASNPYNTYKRPGLPPGPIGNPSQSAFEAALNPPDTPFFFFVAGRSKRHVFSRTLSEHEHAITTERHDSKARSTSDAAGAEHSVETPSAASAP